jgi:hypothetical protein
LRVTRKRGRRDALAINPQTAARIRAYLEMAGYGADIDGPLFRPLKHNGKRQDEPRRMDPDAIDRVVRKSPASSGSTAATRHIRCGRHSSPRRSRTAPSSRMSRRPPGIAIPARPNYMTDAAITQKKLPHFLQRIKSNSREDRAGLSKEAS